MIRIDTQTVAFGHLFQAFTVRAFQGDSFEQDDHDEIKSPHLVCLPQAVDSTHLPFLIGVAAYTSSAGTFFCNASNKFFAAILTDVLPEFSEQTRSPLLPDVSWFALQNKFDHPEYNFKSLYIHVLVFFKYFLGTLHYIIVISHSIYTGSDQWSVMFQQ